MHYMSRKIQFLLLIVLLSLAGLYFVYTTFVKGRVGNYQLVIYNYGTEIDNAAKKYNVNASYLKSLCALESSGKKRPGYRFEPKVYEKLRQLKRAEIARYEFLVTADLRNASDEALRNLATSWGPFQLLGYKCLELGIKVNDLKGDNSVDHSVRWISQSYGYLIRSKRYKDAFHFHNTGRVVPLIGRYLTHDKTYIPRGIRYMEYFSKN